MAVINLIFIAVWNTLVNSFFSSSSVRSLSRPGVWKFQNLFYIWPEQSQYLRKCQKHSVAHLRGPNPATHLRVLFFPVEQKHSLRYVYQNKSSGFWNRRIITISTKESPGTKWDRNMRKAVGNEVLSTPESQWHFRIPWWQNNEFWCLFLNASIPLFDHANL